MPCPCQHTTAFYLVSATLHWDLGNYALQRRRYVFSAGGLGLCKNYKEQIWIIFFKIARRALAFLSVPVTLTLWTLKACSRFKGKLPWKKSTKFAKIPSYIRVRNCKNSTDFHLSHRTWSTDLWHGVPAENLIKSKPNLRIIHYSSWLI